MTVLGVKLLLGLFLTVLSAGFSLAETSFMSLSRQQLTRLAVAHPGRLDFWRRDPDRALAVLLFLNNFVNAGLGVLSVSMALAAAEGLGVPFAWGGVVFPAAAGLFLVVFGEILPKVVARGQAERLALALAPTLEIFSDAFGPWMEGLLKRTGGLLSWLSRTVRKERGQWDAAVIRALLDGAPAAHPVRELLNNVIGFGAVPVKAVMVPREEITAADLSAGKTALIERVLASGYSRVPVFRGSLDSVEGMVYAKDFLAEWRSESLIALDDLVRPVLRVPESTPLAQLLRVFRQGHHHLALVIGADGRLSGLVTLQDTLEAIVGEIAKERSTKPSAPPPS